jgi:hypothetical protein
MDAERANTVTVMNRVRLVDDIRRCAVTLATADLRDASERELWLAFRRMILGIVAAFDRKYEVK